jgi:bifunctional DNA-binding transcriptional regulator/antitoxin component of YhaV-PrlF toxin-antitoxin module
MLYLLNYSKDAAILYLSTNSKDDEGMPKVSPKRQITLPVDQCRQIGIEPGDEYQSFVADGHITIIKKTPGAARGILKHIKGDTSVTDEASLQSILDEGSA